MAPFHIRVALACGALAADGARVKESSEATSYTPVLLKGKMPMKRPAFMMYDPERDDIVVSQFGKETPLGVLNPINGVAHSTISRVPRQTVADDINAALVGGELSTQIRDDAIWVHDGLLWPNKLSKTPSNYPEYTVVPDGFLPPGCEDGGIYLADPSGIVHRVIEPVNDQFYHEVEWHDFSGDGILDMLTARVVKGGPFFAPTFSGQLLWLENPGKNQMINRYWKEHVITAGPDVIFKSKPYGDGLAVYCTEFFAKVPQVSVRLVTMQGKQTAVNVIDNTIGNPFAVGLDDIDGDGTNELVVTNHQDSSQDDIKAAVYAYEIPSDVINGNFVRHTLAYDVSPIASHAPGVGSPGFANVFTPKLGQSGRRHLLVAGDGSFDVWYLKPTGNDKWSYSTEVFYIGGTTGQMLVMDLNGDNIIDALIPDNDNFDLRAITFVEG